MQDRLERVKLELKVRRSSGNLNRLGMRFYRFQEESERKAKERAEWFKEFLDPEILSKCMDLWPWGWTPELGL